MYCKTFTFVGMTFSVFIKDTDWFISDVKEMYIKCM